MNEEITTEGIRCYYSKEMIPSKLDLSYFYSQSEPISTHLPPFDTLYPAGCYVFILKYSQVFAKDDLRQDSLKPWNSTNTRAKVENCLVDGEKLQHLRVRHPIYQGLTKKALCSTEKAVVMYHFANNIDFRVEKFQYVRRSTSAKASVVNEYPTVTETESVNRETESGQQIQESYSIFDLIKAEPEVEEVEPTPENVCEFDINKMMATVIPYNGMLMAEGVNGKTEITCLAVFEETFRIYNGGYPNKEVEPFDCSRLFSEIEAEFSLHTISDFSEIHITFLLDKHELLRERSSRKERPLILGVMLHSSRNPKVYRMFGDRIQDSWKRICNGRPVPTIQGDSYLFSNEDMNEHFNKWASKSISKNLQVDALITKIVEIHEDDMQRLRSSRQPFSEEESAWLPSTSNLEEKSNFIRISGSKRQRDQEVDCNFKRRHLDASGSRYNFENTQNDDSYASLGLPPNIFEQSSPMRNGPPASLAELLEGAKQR